MEFRNFIRSLFGVRRDSRSGIQGWAENGEASHAKGRFDLDEWVRNQKAAYGSRNGLSENLERKAAQFNVALLGLSGVLLDHLVSSALA
jgi:hypothetical protein